MPPEWLCSSCLQDYSPQSLTPLYLCHATINKDTQRMTKAFLKRREGKREAIQRTASPVFRTAILWFSMEYIHACTNCTHMCVARYHWPGGWRVDRVTVCSCNTTAWTQKNPVVFTSSVVMKVREMVTLLVATVSKKKKKKKENLI